MKASSLVLLLALTTTTTTIAQAAARLDLNVDITTGSFHIHHDGKTWVSGGEVIVSGLSAKKGELKITAFKTKDGSDALGMYNATTLVWADTKDMNNVTLMETSFREYPALDSTIVFEQFFPIALGKDSGVHAHRRGDDDHSCRVVTSSNVTLAQSSKGYSAWTKTTSPPPWFQKHPGDYCHANHKWAYTGNVSLSVCQSKCRELDCTCFDYLTSSPSPSPPGPSKLAARTIFPAFSRGDGLMSDKVRKKKHD